MKPPRDYGCLSLGFTNWARFCAKYGAAAIQVEPYELFLPDAEAGLTEELIASIKTADHPTQAVMLDLVKRIPEWKEMLAVRQKRNRRR